MKTIHSSNYNYIAIPLLLLLFLSLSLLSSIKETPTNDEGVHITGGYTILKEHDYRINPENGLLPSIWAAIPLLFINDIKFDKRMYWHENFEEWSFSMLFMYYTGNNYKLIFLLARLMIILAACLAAFSIYGISKDAWGNSGGVFSLILFILSPTILAHSHLATSDMFASIFFMLSIWRYRELLRKVTLKNLFLFSSAITCLALSKMSSILILPIIIIMSLHKIFFSQNMLIFLKGKTIPLYRKLKKTTVVILLLTSTLLLTVTAIWAAYGFRYSMLRNDHTLDTANKIEQIWSYSLTNQSLPMKAVEFAKKHRLLPEGYLFGFAFVIKNSESRNAFLDGEFSKTGWLSFFPLVFIYKTPPITLLLFLLGIVALIGKILYNKKQKKGIVIFYKLAPFLIFAFYYFAIAMFSNINIGQRHILPVYMPLFIISGGTVLYIQRYIKPMLFIIILFFLYFIQDLYIFPNYLSYFSPIAGGSSNGYKHLIDSSLDWGQGLYQVKDFLDKNEINNNKSYIASFSNVPLDALGINSQRLHCCVPQETNFFAPLRGGIYCLSATMTSMTLDPEYRNWNTKHDIELQKMTKTFLYFLKLIKEINSKHMCLTRKQESELKSFYNKYNKVRFAKLAYYLRQREPDIIIANSYLIYNLTDEEVHKILNEHFSETVKN